MSYSDIFKDAALLQLTATCWSIDRKLPPALLAEVGNVDYLKGRKLLLDPESTAPIKQITGKARNYIRKLALPFPIRGCVLVPRKLIPAIQDQLSTFKNDYECPMCPADATGQVIRVIRNFALVATAGEFAIEHGILPWSKLLGLFWITG